MALGFFLYSRMDLNLAVTLGSAANLLKIEFTVFISGVSHKTSQQIIEKLDEKKIPWQIENINPTLSRIKSRMGPLWPNLSGLTALITAVESSSKAHSMARRLILKAKSQGITCFTFQHGLENIGLNYADAEYPAGTVEFYSDYIFTWCGINNLASWVPKGIQKKIIPLGRAEAFCLIHNQKPKSKTLLIFENLHWKRYSLVYKSQFLIDLILFTVKRSDWSVIVKPHPAGCWFSNSFFSQLQNFKNLLQLFLMRPDNYVLRKKIESAVSQQDLNLFLNKISIVPNDGKTSTQDLFLDSSAVITTPSTISLEAAAAGLPTAVARYDLDLNFYSPLPQLSCLSDWVHFVDSLEEQQKSFSSLNSSFVDKHCVQANIAFDALKKIQELS